MAFECISHCLFTIWTICDGQGKLWSLFLTPFYLISLCEPNVWDLWIFTSWKGNVSDLSCLFNHELLDGRRIRFLCVHVCVCLSLSCVRLYTTPWIVAGQVPLSVGFSRQEYWNGLPFPSSGDVPDPGDQGSNPDFPHCGRFFFYHLSQQGKCFSLSGSKESNSGRRMCYQEGRFWLKYENWNHLKIEWVP